MWTILCSEQLHTVVNTMVKIRYLELDKFVKARAEALFHDDVHLRRRRSAHVNALTLIKNPKCSLQELIAQSDCFLEQFKALGPATDWPDADIPKLDVALTDLWKFLSLRPKCPLPKKKVINERLQLLVDIYKRIRPHFWISKSTLGAFYCELFEENLD